MAKKLTSAKAKEILKDGTVHGKDLTPKQKRFFGAIAGGEPNWLDKYEDGGELNKPKTSKRTTIFNADTLTLPENSFVKYKTNEKKSRLKGTSVNEEINKAADWLTNW